MDDPQRFLNTPHIHAEPRPSEPLPPHPAFRSEITKPSHTSLWVILVLIILSGACYSVYIWQHRQISSLHAQVLNEQHTVNRLQGQLSSTPAASTGTTNSNASGPGLVGWDFLDTNLQNAILTRWQAMTPNAANDNANTCKSPQNQSYWVEVKQSQPVKDTAAIANIGCANPQQVIFTLMNGAWTVVSTSKTTLKCSTLLQYVVPLALLQAADNNKATCLMPTGNMQTIGS